MLWQCHCSTRVGLGKRGAYGAVRMVILWHLRQHVAKSAGAGLQRKGQEAAWSPRVSTDRNAVLGLAMVSWPDVCER